VGDTPGREALAALLDDVATGWFPPADGLGRALAAAARHLVPGGSPLWAQIAPANAASVRAFLAAGFKSVGAEAHLAVHTSGA
jgi:hypothetical protein